MPGDCIGTSFEPKCIGHAALMFSNNASHRERCSDIIFMWTNGCVSEGCFRQRRASRFAAAAASCQQRKLILKILQNSEFLYFIYKAVFWFNFEVCWARVVCCCARCCIRHDVQDLDACRRCCYGYRCLLLQPTLSINKEMSHLPSQSSVFVLRQPSYHQASGQPK